MKHGRLTRYQYGCRCVQCIAARRAYDRGRRTRTQATLPASSPLHGQTRTYAAGCRCESCRAAAAAYKRAWRARRGGAA